MIPHPLHLALCALVLVTASSMGQASAFVPQSPLLEPASEIRRIVRQTDDGNGEAPTGMVHIPAGEATLGVELDRVAKLGQNDQFQMMEIAAETPRHTVLVEDFFIDQTEVTNLQWWVYLQATGRKPSEVLVKYGWPEGRIPNGQDYYPITNVNFPEVLGYLEWSGTRLPTEAEWVRAARADSERDYPWGDAWPRGTRKDPHKCQSGMSSPQRISEVGSFPEGASAFGVLDMAGNVFEWVQSPFAAFPGFRPVPFRMGRKSVSLTPEFNSTNKVAKGGCYISTRTFCRIDGRIGVPPSDSDAALGFRAARSARHGLEAIRHGFRKLLPPQFASTPLDEQDIFGREITLYEPGRRVIIDYRHLAFAHRDTTRGKPLSKIRSTSKEEPLALGVLVTSEPMAMADMSEFMGTPAQLPPGEYVLAFKGEGESKAHRKERLKARKNGKRPAGNGAPRRNGAAPAAGADDPATTVADLGAAVPWPGVLNANDIAEPVDFPQDIEVLLFYNANHIVVGWCKPLEVLELALAPMAAKTTDDGHTWDIAFSLDNQLGKRRKQPRFHFQVTLAGPGLQ